MASISLGDQAFVGTDNFPIAMVEQLATQLLGKNVTVTVSGSTVTISQGATQIGTFDLSAGTEQVWFALASILFSGATSKDIHVDDRIVYTEGYTRGIDWRDMTNSTTINENRYLDDDLTIAANNAAFTIDGFGDDNFTKIIALRLRSNTANTGEGALAEFGLGDAMIRVNSTGEVQANTALGGTVSWSTFQDASGNVSLSAGDDNWLIFELLPRAGVALGMEYVGVFYDGTNYRELNNINATRSAGLTGDDIGVSRNSVQRGQVLEFKVINSSGYLSHSAIENLARQHIDDKWNFGFARLIAGGTFKEIDFATRVNLPEGSTLNGVDFVKPESVVYEATSTTEGAPGLVSQVDLPVDYTDYKYVHITEYDKDSFQWRHAEFPVTILENNYAANGDSIRLQGNTALNWTNSLRRLSMAGNVIEIFRVSLKD